VCEVAKAVGKGLQALIGAGLCDDRVGCIQAASLVEPVRLVHVAELVVHVERVGEFKKRGRNETRPAASRTMAFPAGVARDPRTFQKYAPTITAIPSQNRANESERGALARAEA